jgi:dienelactone hydrolase
MRWLVLFVALAAMSLSIWKLESGRSGLTIAPLVGTGTTPATIYLRDGGGPAPVVVIAHGFAGSRQLMEGFAFTLAQAGYTVVSYDLEGHGRNPVPMSGDVTSIDGTTRLLVNEARRVAQAALAHPRSDGRLAFLGHSMASDIAVRAALAVPPADAVVGVSMFSQAVTATEPRNLLVIAGEWEAHLATEALAALRLADPALHLGMTAGDPATGTGRRAVLAPSVEHVGVLYSATTLRETRDWLDRSFGRNPHGAPQQPVAMRGGWIALLLVATILLAWPLSQLLPQEQKPRQIAAISRTQFWILTTIPAAITPLALVPVSINVLPVLVADYLALHLGLYGLITLLLFWWFGLLRGHFEPRIWWIAATVALFGIGVFGGVLDRYVTSFFPHSGRAIVIAGLALGAVPFSIGDALITEGGRASLWRVIIARSAFLVSLGVAVTLDFESLFFLIIILPIIVLFFFLFGSIAGWVGRRTSLQVAGGFGLGLILAWSLGVTFPMFTAA